MVNAVGKRSHRRTVGKNTVSVERAKSGQGWVLRHPSTVRECAEDLEEVRRIIEAGEADVARDELHWLLGICHDLIEGHFWLGQIAVDHGGDVSLARMTANIESGWLEEIETKGLPMVDTSSLFQPRSEP